MAQLHVLMGDQSVDSRPKVRRIGMADIGDALARGLADFLEHPSGDRRARGCGMKERERGHADFSCQGPRRCTAIVAPV